MPEKHVGLIFAADELPENSILVSKHIRVGTQCEVYFMICFIVFYVVHFVCLKCQMNENAWYE
jgi:cytosine/uracil/thiamine/allantoin permease